jgi:hypothetical protein
MPRAQAMPPAQTVLQARPQPVLKAMQALRAQAGPQ